MVIICIRSAGMRQITVTYIERLGRPRARGVRPKAPGCEGIGPGVPVKDLPGPGTPKA